MTYTFSSQAIGSIMMALQNSLMNQTDIVPIFSNFQIQIDDSGQVVIMNPPVVETATKGETIETSVQ